MCLAQEHKATPIPACRARTWTPRSRVQRTNHKDTASICINSHLWNASKLNSVFIGLWKPAFYLFYFSVPLSCRNLVACCSSSGPLRWTFCLASSASTAALQNKHSDETTTEWVVVTLTCQLKWLRQLCYDVRNCRIEWISVCLNNSTVKTRV